MPLYEYECLSGHRQEKYFNISNFPDKIICETCAKIYEFEVYAKKVWSLPANIQIGKPTIVFTNPSTSESRVAISENESAPPGFIKNELKSSIERTKFENVQNEIYRQQDEIYNEGLKQDRELFRKERTNQLNAEMSSIVAQSDNPSATESLMKAAISRKRKPLKKRKTQFALEVNHLDKSNL